MEQPLTEINPSSLLLRMSGIRKHFAGVVALDNVSLELAAGQCHAIVGENGAGKSTLMKILSGAYTPDGGTVEIDGAIIDNPTPTKMLEHGVTVIYQELTLAPHLTVAENVFLGRLPRNRFGVIQWNRIRRATREALNRLGVNIHPDALVTDLSIAQRQMVEIARALTQNARILILDEPSAVLGDTEIERLFTIMRGLQAEGVSFLYISHRLKEVFEIAQTVTVIRDGKTITTAATTDLDTDALVSHMVGRELSDIYPERNRVPGDVVLTARGLTRDDAVYDIDIELRAGEIVGIAGLAGAGRTETLRLLAGADRKDSGEVHLHGKPVHFRNPREAVDAGIGLLPEDRKGEGLFLSHSVRFNMSIASLKRVSSAGILRLREERDTVTTLSKSLRVKAPSVEFAVRNLSGGNQQKSVLGRWLAADCSVLLADEPTRGVDVGAKQDIYRLLDEFARRGMAVLFVSSELPEVLGLADRILVLREGRITAELSGRDATEEMIMHHATDASGRAVA